MATRRQILNEGGRAAAFGMPLLFGLPACAPAESCDDPPAAASERPLKLQAETRGLHFGSAADRDVLENDHPYAEKLVSECAVVTPENSMKWERLRPSPIDFDFENADWLIDFAEANDLQVHGHTLVWHLQNPAWLDGHLTPRNAEAVLNYHIENVARRYAGRVRSWDVVNEAIDDDTSSKDGLRPSPWLRSLGPEYIDLAFYMTRQVELNADLVYNDYGLEYEGGWYEERRRHTLNLLTGMVTRGVPIDALGVQSHLHGRRTPNFEPFARFLDEVSALGLDIMITELDVSDQELPADKVERDCLIAKTYKGFLDVVLANPSVRSIAVWGLSDRHSWLSDFKQRDDGEPVRPLPLDIDLKRKPAWNAISSALSEQT